MIISMQIFRRKDLYDSNSNFSIIVGKFYNKSMRRERVYLGATGTLLFRDCTLYDSSLQNHKGKFW